MTRHLHAVPVSTHPPMLLPAYSSLADAIAQTQEVCATHQAVRLDLTVVDVAGWEIAPERLDAGLPEQLRLAAVAVFPGHEVFGLSDPIDREVYPGRAHTIEWQQALGQLRALLDPPTPPWAVTT